MVQIFNLPQKRNPIGNLGAALGQGIQQGAAFGLQKNFEQMQEHQAASNDISGLQAAYDSANPNDPESLFKAIYLAPGVRPEAKKMFGEAILSQQKNVAEKQYKERYVAALEEKNKVAANKPAATNKFSPLPPEQQETVNQFLADPQTRNLDDVSFYAEGVKRNIPPPEMERLTKVRQEQKKGAAQEYKNLREIHEETKDFEEELEKEYKSAKKQRVAIHEIRKAVTSNKVGPYSAANIAQKHLKDTFLEHAFDTEESGTFQAAEPELLGGFEHIFKRGLTDRDLRLILNKIPGIGKPKEVNLATADYLEKALDLTEKKYKIAQEIKRENKGLRPQGYVDEIDRRYEERYGDEADQLYSEITGMVRMYDPKTGEDFPVPVGEVPEAMQGGALRR